MSEERFKTITTHKVVSELTGKAKVSINTELNDMSGKRSDALILRLEDALNKGMGDA